VVIAGAGMRLQGAGHTVVLQAPYEPYTFSGDVELDCELIDGPVRDFNLMVRRSHARGEVSVMRDAGARIRPAHFRFCYTVAGSCECLVAGHPPLAIPTDHALRIEDDPTSAAPLLPEPAAEPPDEVVVVAGDNLWELAARQLAAPVGSAKAVTSNHPGKSGGGFQ